MSDKDFHEDEYQFPDEESYHADPAADTSAVADDIGEPVEHSFDESKVPPSFLKKLLAAVKEQWQRHPRAIGIIGFIIIAVIFLNLIGGHTASAQYNKLASAQTQPVAKPAAAPKLSAEQMQQLNQNLQASDAHSGANTKALSSLNKNMVANQSSIARVQMDMQGLKQSLSAMAVQQAETNKAISIIAENLQALQQQTLPKHTKKAAPAKPVVYTIRAVVPQRAWIRGSDGSSRTVAVGDMIKGYGKVVKIMPQRGMLLMSSGKTIVFGAEDR